MMRRFYVIHSLGVDAVSAETAEQALKKAFVPRGFRDAHAVIDAEVIGQDARVSGPFRAFIGEGFGAPAANGKGAAA